MQERPVIEAAPEAFSEVLRLEGLNKRFGGVRALRDVSFAVSAGRIHAVVGENGAGKSTLMKILVGVHHPDSGTVFMDGSAVSISDPAAARRAGIDIVFQEIELPGNLTIADCIFLGREPTAAGFLRHGWMLARSADVLAHLELALPPNTPIARLSVAQKQLVQIARAVGHKARILIMDEPTSSISDHEVRRLFDLLDRLRRQGVTILYVSHKLDEVFRLADQVTVLRDGRHVFTGPTAELDQDRLVGLMVGRVQDAALRKSAAPRTIAETAVQQERKPVVLEALGLSRQGKFDAIDLRLRAGCITGMFGIVGAGRTEVARAIFGLDPLDAGRVRLHGKTVAFRHPSEAIAAGLGYIPEDRQTCGLILQLAVGRNISLASLPRLTHAGLVSHRQEWQLAADGIRQLRLVTSSQDQAASTLSGGNQQKAVIAKWLALRPKVLILDEPTKGIDINTKQQVHDLTRRLAQSGMAILLISSELDEVLALSDEILVMSRGRLVGRPDPRTTTRQEVLRLALS